LNRRQENRHICKKDIGGRLLSRRVNPGGEDDDMEKERPRKKGSRQDHELIRIKKKVSWEEKGKQRC